MENDWTYSEGQHFSRKIRHMITKRIRAKVRPEGD